jgi:hypothetical protein
MIRKSKYEAEVNARRLDWALREVVAEQWTPDVAGAVLSRAAAGDRGDDAATMRPVAPSRSRWLALAALFLLGLVTVVGVGWLRGGNEHWAFNEAQGRDIRVVTRAVQIASLPLDLQAVELHNLDDEAVAAVVQRCPELKHLCVFASTAMSRYASIDDEAISITDDALVAIGSLDRLRRLELVGVQHVRGTKLSELERLPLLEHLALTFFDLDDDSLQSLPRMQSLRELDLSGNQGYGERGLAAVGACRGLRVLSLSGSAPLLDAWFVSLKRLAKLQSLNLQGTGLMRRMLYAKGFPEPRSPKFDDRSISVAALQRWPALRDLSLANALHIEPSVGAQLARECPALETLVIDYCQKVDDATVAALLALPSLRSLSMRNCPKVTAASVPLLVAAKQLREVNFGETPWLTLEQAKQLAQADKSVTCSRPDDPDFEAAMARIKPQ